MSRNYDLMQEIERDQALRSNWAVGQAPHIPGEDGNGHPGVRLADELTAGLVQRTLLLKTPERPHMVVFAGVEHGNGCSGIALSVAETLAANAPGNVCLVDANFRSPKLAAMLGVTNYRGLTDALLFGGSARSFMTPVHNESLWLLSSGPFAADSANLLTSERMKTLFEELRREFDFVIVDTPPLTRYADAIALGQLSDGVVMVIEAESTRRTSARAAADSLRSCEIRIIGAVLNKRTFPIPEKIYRRL
jgi:capsular exopolysaccharide synthesis family protein